MLKSLLKILNPQCSDSSFLDEGITFYDHPTSVFVKPWRGRHNVYGIFELPSERALKYPIMLTVEGAGSYRKEAQMVKTQLCSYHTEPGHTSIKVCLKTRVALLMIMRGSLGVLRNPLNWKLTYTTLN